MRRILLILSIFAVVAGLSWAVLARSGVDGGTWGWSSASGTLKVLPRGVAVLPRWSWNRLPGGSLDATVDAASREGVRAAVAVAVTPPVGELALAPAADPASGLALAVGPGVRQRLAAVPAGCLGTGPASSGCPADLDFTLAAEIADSIGVEPAAVTVSVTPDALAMRTYLLGQVRSALPPADRRVLLVGLDAVDWPLLLPLVDRGLMPNLGRLLAAGTWGEMDTIVPMLSPLIWTTMATGFGPDEHGILDFVQKDPETGLLLPVTGRQRRVPAIWNMATAMGRTVDVVGWWATWPAERIAGTMVSDRLYYTLTQGIDEDALREDPPDMVSPPAAAARFTALRDATVQATDFQVMRGFMEVPRAAFEAALAADRGWEDPIDGTRRVIASTRTYFGAARELAAGKPDLLMLYIEGTDEIAHILAPYTPPPLVDVPAATAAAYAAAVPRYFHDVDRQLGQLLDACPLSECTVMVLSDHGFTWGADRPTKVSGTAGPTAPLWHDDQAVFLLAGSGVPRTGRVRERASVYDVAPTLAALLHLPADAAWRGAPLPGTPPDRRPPLDYAALVPPETYRNADGAATPVDPEYVAKLESLGYLSKSPTGAPGEAVEAVPALPTSLPTSPRPTAAPTGTEQGSTTTRGQLNNLAVIKMKEKKFDEAERLLRQAVEMSPEYAAPHYNLRHLYMELGRYDDADRELWLAVDKGLRDPERSVDRAAADYEGLNMPERADALLEHAVKEFPDHEPFWVHALVVKLRLDRCAEGVGLGARAVVRFPDSAPVHAFYGLSAACAGDAETARRELARSLELKPDQPRLRQALAALGP